MRSLRAPVVAALLLGAVTVSRTVAQSLDETQPTRTITGPAWTNDKMKNRAVMILFWAAADPKCAPVMKLAARLDGELAPFGLVVIGAHMQKTPDAQVEAKARSFGVRFSITENYGFKSARQIMVPSALIFGGDGMLQFDGAADKGEFKVRSVLGRAILDRATTKTFGKSVETSVDNLRKGISPVTVLATLASKKNDADAKVLVDAICASGKEQLDDAKDRLETDPVGVYGDAERLSKVFKGTPLGVESNDLFTKLKNDKLVQQELKAHPSLEKVQKIDEQLEKAMKMESKNDPSAPEFQKAHQPQISQIKMIATQMRATWPKTRATSEASDIAMKYGVMFK
jgi:hypothetical protein